MSLIARLGVILGLDNKEFISGIDDATKKTREFEMNQKRALRNAQKAQDEFMGLAAKGLAGIAAAALAVGKAFQYADQIEDTAKAYDVTTQSLMALQAAFVSAGGEADNAGGALQKLAVAQQSAIDGSDELRESFAKLGISGKDVEELQLGDLFKRVAQELSKVENATQRTALQTDLLGKAVKGTNWKDFVNNYKELGDPLLLKAIEENAKAWGNIEATFKELLMVAQKLVMPFALIVNSISDIRKEYERLQKGGGAEIDFGAALGGMPGEAIVGQYYDVPSKSGTKPIAKAAQAGDYKSQTSKQQSEAKKAADEAKRIKEARDALQLEIKLIKEKADIADKMFVINSKGITLGQNAIAQEKMSLELATDIAEIRSAASKERIKDKAQIDLINAKESAAIEARQRQYQIESALNKQRIAREHQLTMDALDFEAKKSTEINAIEFNAQMDLFALEKQKYTLGQNQYELKKLEVESSNALAKAASEYSLRLEEINNAYEHSGKTEQDLAIKQKNRQNAYIAFEEKKDQMLKSEIAQREVLMQKQERDHLIAMKAITSEKESKHNALMLQTQNEHELLNLERQKFELGSQAYELQKIDLVAKQQIKQIEFDTSEKIKQINNDYELTGKTAQDIQLKEENINAALTSQEERIGAVLGLQKLRLVATEEQLALEDKLFKLDIAQQKGRDIANIQTNLNIEKQRLQLESQRYLLTQNQYDKTNLLIDNANRLAEAEKKYNDEMIQAQYEMERQGGGQKAREKYEQRIKAITEVRDIELETIQQINDARQRNLDQEIQRQQSFTEGWSYAMRKYQEDAEKSFDRGARAFNSVMGNMESAIDKFVETGKFSFSDFATSVIKDLIKIQMQEQATKLFSYALDFAGSLSGGGSKGVNFDAGIGGNAGFAAAGGSIDGPTIVGENGPELFIPTQRGTVIPNTIAPSMAGMGQPQVVYNGPYIQNMSAIDTQSAAQFLSKNRMSVYAAGKYAEKSLMIRGATV